MQIKHEVINWGNSDSYSFIAWNDFNDKNYIGNFKINTYDNKESLIQKHLKRAKQVFIQTEIYKNLENWFFEGERIEDFIEKSFKEMPEYVFVYEEESKPRITIRKPSDLANLNLRDIKCVKVCHFADIDER